MDEKQYLIRAAVERRYAPPARRRRVVRTGLALLVLLGVCVVLFMQPAAARFDGGGRKPQKPVGVETGDEFLTTFSTSTTSRAVPLEAHIMSKCPDAQACLRELVLPTMQLVSDKVNFTLSFIGTATDADDGVECMHGPAECMGDVLELCAAALYPDPKIYLGFAWCLTREFEAIPDRALVQDCALEHAIDVTKLDACATRDDSGYAMGLLRASVQRSAAAGVTRSCTVRLDEHVYCIHDGGGWTECPTGPGVHDLVVAIEKKWQEGE